MLSSILGMRYESRMLMQLAIQWSRQKRQEQLTLRKRTTAEAHGDCVNSRNAVQCILFTCMASFSLALGSNVYAGCKNAILFGRWSIFGSVVLILPSFLSDIRRSSTWIWCTRKLYEGSM